MQLTERLVQGVDVWLQHAPASVGGVRHKRHERVLVNGGINLSELDGWWAEAFVPASAGRWATVRKLAVIRLGTRRGRGAIRLTRTRGDSRIYTRNEKGIPTAWVNDA